MAVASRRSLRKRADRYHHGDLRPARELRYRLALQLAANGRWPEYVDLYNRYAPGTGPSAIATP